MPQFEVETLDGTSRILRAKSPADAARRAGLAGATDGVEVGPEADVQGWRAIIASGAEVGRVRDHQRMRFRRD